MVYMIPPVTYMQLKEDRKGRQKKILEIAKEGDINMFMVVKSDENHHTIIDKRSVTLGYCYCIKPNLLKMLEQLWICIVQ
jgi:hypothetical protein